ncbi:MAG: GntR family transcriptional regulator [Lentisphaeria bacterium]|nr:GntR family transcriptional regulator [Lentisphaeria bacterium]
MDIFREFRHTGSGSIHQELACFLKSRIESGALRPGEALPPLRTLSKELGINFFSVKLATDALVDWGLLTKQQGRGMFIAPAGTRISRVGIYSCARYLPNRDLSFYTVLQQLVCAELRRRGIAYAVYDDRETLRQAILTDRIQALIGIYVDDRDKKFFLNLPVRKVNMMRDLLFDFTPIADVLNRRGCRRIAAVVPAAFPRGSQSFLIAGLKTCGVRIMPKNIRNVDPAELEKRSWAEIGYQAARAFLSATPRPDALIVYPDNAVLGAIQAIYESRVKVPEELTLVFHRNLELSYFCALEALYMDTGIASVAARLVENILEAQER